MLDMRLSPVDGVLVDRHLGDGGVGRDIVHNGNQQIFDHAAQTARAALALDRFAGDGMQGGIGKDQLGVIEMQQLLVLAYQAVFRLSQHADQGVLVQRIQHGDDRQTADQLGNQAELDQIIWLDLFQQLLAGLILIQRSTQLACRYASG